MFDQRDCVLIIGAGRSGIATAEVLRARKVTVAVFDDQPAEKLGDSAATLLRLGAALIRDAELPAAAAAATAAVVSPGVPLTNCAMPLICHPSNICRTTRFGSTRLMLGSM